MTTPPGPSEPVPHIPADRLYWAVIPQGARLGEAARRFRCEQVLPVSVDSLHTATAVTGSGDVVLIGIDRDTLVSELAKRTDVMPDTWRLTPDAIPAHVQAAGIDRAFADRLNLLTGACEPLARRRLRRIAVIVPIAAMVLMSLLIVVGTQRRVGFMHRQAVDIRNATDTIIAAALPPSTTGLDPLARLTMEVRRLTQAQHGQADLDRFQDVAASLAGCLRRWPTDLRTQVETLTATAQRIVVRGHAATLGDAEHLAQALNGGGVAAVHWRAEPVQATQTATGADYTLNLLPVAPVTK
ncbi:MAG: hypothetical protein H0W83_04660 [Planctomycetes bacterium]|nr:hypothetical protein [Planctomycetota bacterium]